MCFINTRIRDKQNFFQQTYRLADKLPLNSDQDGAALKPKIRLALVGLYHETNTFSSVPADYNAFSIFRGEEIEKEYGNSLTTNAGYLAISSSYDNVDVVPLVFAITGPIGTITKDAFDQIVGEMIQYLEDQGPWDGILLSLHGAAVSEEYSDCDGEITYRVRSLVGPDVPVGLSVDMHANISQKMVENTDVLTVYRTNPHLDAKERSQECADLIVKTINGQIEPVMWLETPPMVINIVNQFTGDEPMRSIMSNLLTVLEKPGVIHGSVAEGYPYADVPEMGMGFLTVVDSKEIGKDEANKTAREGAQWMATRAWAKRDGFNNDTPDPVQALLSADAQHSPGDAPIVLMDVGDNIGAGSSADSTHILAEAQRLGIEGYLQTLYDPASVQKCLEAGVGSNVSLKVGGKTDHLHGSPIPIGGKVRTLFNGKFEDHRPTHGGFRFYDGGLTAVVDTTDGHTIVLTSLRCGNTSLEQMYSAGVDPTKYRIVVAKGVVSPRPAYQPIAKEIILVNTPGVTTSDLEYFEYHRRRGSLFPFDRDADYLPSRQNQ